MGAIDNLNKGELGEIYRRLKELELATPNNSSSIGAGGMRVHSGGVITIENGGLYVNGSATIIGTLNADGTINMTGLFVATGEVELNGPTSVTGDFTVTGPTKLNGQTDIGGDTSVTGDLDVEGPLTVTGDTKLDGKTDIGGDTTVDGTLDIKGKSTLQNDLTVQGGGKIKVGSNMTITPATGGGSVEFANGASVSSSGTDLKMDASGAALSLGTQAVMTGGSSTVVVAGSSTSLNTPLVILSSRVQARQLRHAPSGAEANIYCDPSTGELMRII